LARWPGTIAAGSTSNRPAYFGDLLGTVCDLAGVPVPAGTDSISFLPALTGKGQATEHRYLYWEFHEQGSRQAVRFGDWKAIREPMLTGSIRLFNLKADPGEQIDLASTIPGRGQEAARMLDEAHVPNPDWPVPGEGLVDQKGRRPRVQAPTISRAGCSRQSLIRVRKVTASLPSMRRWS